MKNLVTLFLLIWAFTAQAKDFRVLDFGESCEGLIEVTGGNRSHLKLNDHLCGVGVEQRAS